MLDCDMFTFFTNRVFTLITQSAVVACGEIGADAYLEG